MDSSTSPLLPQLSSKTFPHPVLSHLTAYCTTHDLLAVVSSTLPAEVLVFRLNSQPVFSIKRASGIDEDAVVSALQWKSDGGALAIGWSDGVYGVYDGQAGLVMGVGSVRERGGAQRWRLDLEPGFEGVNDDDGEGGEAESVVLFGWGEHELGKSQSHQRGEALSTEEWADGADEDELAPEEHLTNRGGLADLTTALTTLDVTKILPRLSGIPAHTIRPIGDGTKFVSQAATDGIFETQKDSSLGRVETLLVCGSQGNVRVLMDNTVKIGSCHVEGSPIMHEPNGKTGKQIILSQRPQQGVSVHFLDLPIDVLGGSLHHVIATNTKRIQNLLAYITHTVRCINHDLTTGLQFPGRLISNMNEELAEKQEGDVVSSLYHLAMTGDFTPVMLEWLVDIVKETNHKRWDQAVSTMYTHIQTHIFIHLLPALDRLSIATTTLRGHAQYHQGTSRFDVAPESFTKILDGIDGLRLVGQKLQLIVMTEHRQFKAFSKWLRIMVDLGVAGPGSKSAAETEEREIPNLDYPLLLAYIKDTLMQSRLAKHTASRPEMRGACTWEEFVSHPTIARMSYDHTLKALSGIDARNLKPRLDLRGVQDADALLNLPALAVYLAGHVKSTLDRITAWQSKMLKPPRSYPLPVETTQEIVITDLHVPGSIAEITFAQLDPSDMSTLGQYAIPLDISKQLQGQQIQWQAQRFHVFSFSTKVLSTKRSGQTLLVFLSHGSPPMYSIEALSLTTDATQSLHVFSRPDFIPDARQPNPFHLGPRPVVIVFGSQGREWRALDLKSVVDTCR